MQLHDPARPQVNGRPGYTAFQAVLPQLTFWPLAGGQVSLSLWLPVAWNEFSLFTTTFQPHELPGVLSDYSQDPEGLLYRLFSFRQPQLTAPKPKPRIPTLADLGLLPNLT